MDNSVIRRLADIDLAARSIIDDAREEQKKIADDFRKQTEAFDRQADEESERKLAEIREALRKENTEAAEKLEADMEESLALVKKYYEDQIDLRADEIVAQILEAQ